MLAAAYAAFGKGCHTEILAGKGHPHRGIEQRQFDRLQTRQQSTALPAG